MLQLTRQERGVLTVVLLLFFFGLGVKAWMKSRGPVAGAGSESVSVETPVEAR